MRQCVIYTRVSPRKKDETKSTPDSCEAQEFFCREQCERLDMRVPVVLSDPGESACKTFLFDRPSGSKLKDLAAEYGNVMVYKLDRLFRDTIDGLEVMHSWSGSVFLCTCDGRTYDTQNPDNEFFLTIELALDQREAALTRKRTKDICRFHRDSGLYMGGVVDYGRMLDPNDSTRTLPCAEEIDVMIRIAGYEARGFGQQAIADKLNLDGVAHRSGEGWTRQRVDTVLRKVKEHGVPEFIGD